MRANRSNLINLFLIVGAVALAASFTEVLASPSPTPSPTAAATMTPSPSPQAYQPEATPQPIAPTRPSFGRGIYPPAAPPFRQK